MPMLDRAQANRDSAMLGLCFFPKQCGNTWGSYGNSKRPGCLDRGAGEVSDGIHRYFRGFVLACSFRL